MMRDSLVFKGPEKQSLFSFTISNVDVALEIRVADTDQVEWRGITIMLTEANVNACLGSSGQSWAQFTDDL